MSTHRATHDFGDPGNTAIPEQPRQAADSVILFIGAVLIAGLTCILYLWQQGQIVATQQDIRTLDAKYTALLTQKSDLAAQVSRMNAVSNVVAQATKAGMVMGDSRLLKTLDVSVSLPNNTLVAQNQPAAAKSSVALPSTNAAITSWWQDAWDGAFSLLQ